VRVCATFSRVRARRPSLLFCSATMQNWAQLAEFRGRTGALCGVRDHGSGVGRTRVGVKRGVLYGRRVADELHDHTRRPSVREALVQ